MGEGVKDAESSVRQAGVSVLTIRALFLTIDASRINVTDKETPWPLPCA
jgi:hypothetical protein